MTEFVLGTSSKRELATVCLRLQKVVELAITLTDVDFSVVEGERTPEKQRQNIRDGVSWSMDSDHLPDEVGLVKAVDIYPWVNGATSHDPEHYDRVAKAMFKAASQLSVQLDWGGFWHSPRKDRPHWSCV